MWDFPWQPVDPLGTLARHSSFACAEAVFFCTAAAGVWHALAPAAAGSAAAPHRRRRRGALLLAAVLGGLGNDVIFSWLPLVDNFFHAQGALMVTPRFPLYIAAWYVGWLYTSTVLVWRLGFPRAHAALNAALVSLLSAALYAPWDLVGAKYLWWTWHDSDKVLQHRWLGVPWASTMFTLVYAFCWSWIFHRVAFQRPHWRHPRAAVAAAACGGVPLMMVAMTVLGSLIALRPPPAPPPSGVTVVTTVLLLLLMVAKGVVVDGAVPSRQVGRDGAGRADGVLFGGLALHFCFLLSTPYVWDPRDSRSTGVHEAVGFTDAECAERAEDLQGWSRSLYLCKTTAWHYTVCDPPTPTGSRSWYTLCGTEFGPGWRAAATGVVLTAALVHAAVVWVGLASKRRVHSLTHSD